MKSSEITDVVSCLDSGRTLFYYFKDRYCFDFIQYEMERQNKPEIAIHDLKKSVNGRFLNKPAIKQAIGAIGKTTLNVADLEMCKPIRQMPFTLTVARWGNGQRGHDQTTRNQGNLVLQLNFSNQHKQLFKRLVKPSKYERPFSFFGHPIRQDNRDTLAWARMDVSIETNEVLIEEIQNDWLRRADWLLRHVICRQHHDASFQPSDTYYDINCDTNELHRYVHEVLEPYKQVWAEAMLTATIEFIWRELGINHVYYHTFETGNKLKAVPGEPPRSIYTKLPKQFGFKVTNEAPVFIAENKFAKRTLKRIKQPSWHYLNL